MARLYTAYVRNIGPAAVVDDGALTLVKDGFSWPAFLFAVPWALWHRMWVAAAVLIALQIALGTLPGLAGFGETAQGLLSLGLALAVGLVAADLRDGALLARGYRAADVVIAENSDMAARRFLERRPELAAAMVNAVREGSAL